MKSVVKALNVFTIGVCLLIAGCVPVNGAATQPPLSPSSPVPSPVDSYRAEHGRLVVDAANLDYFTYEVLFEVSLESREPEVVLPKGEYAVTVYLTDATSYVANVTVNGNMETTTVVPRSDPLSFEKIVADMGRRDHVLPLGAGRYLAYDNQHKPRIQVPEGVSVPKLPLKRVEFACYLDGRHVVLLGDVSRAFVFDTAVGDFTVFQPDGVEWGSFPFESGRCVDGVLQLVSGSQILRVGLSSVETIEVPSLGRIALGGLANPAVDTGGGVIAVVTVAEVPGDPTIPEIQEILDATLVLVDRATGTQREVDLGWGIDDFYVSVSPDGGMVAVRDDNLVSVYDMVSAKLLYVVPCSSDAIYWLSNDTFIYRGEIIPSDLYFANVTSRESFGLSYDTKIDVSTITGVVGGYLYFIALLSDTTDNKHIGYRAALT